MVCPLVGNDLNKLVREFTLSSAKFVVPVESMVGNKLPVHFLREGINLSTVLVFLVEIEFGSEDDEATHLNIPKYSVKGVNFPTIIVDHTGRNDNIVFAEMTFVEFILAKYSFIQIFVAFGIFGGLK